MIVGFVCDRKDDMGMRCGRWCADASMVFRDLRVLFGVDDESYIRSINLGGLSEISTEETGSKSGQKFLITSDGRSTPPPAATCRPATCRPATCRPATCRHPPAPASRLARRLLLPLSCYCCTCIVFLVSQ